MQFKKNLAEMLHMVAKSSVENMPELKGEFTSKIAKLVMHTGVVYLLRSRDTVDGWPRSQQGKSVTFLQAFDITTGKCDPDPVDLGFLLGGTTLLFEVRLDTQEIKI